LFPRKSRIFGALKIPEGFFWLGCSEIKSSKLRLPSKECGFNFGHKICDKSQKSIARRRNTKSFAEGMGFIRTG